MTFCTIRFETGRGSALGLLAMHQHAVDDEADRRAKRCHSTKQQSLVGVDQRARNAMLCDMATRKSRSDNPALFAERENLGLLGVGLDGDDGHKRLTRGEGFCVVGGSAETHERMQDLVIRMDEKLRRQGKRFQDLSRPEFENLARDSLE